MNTTRKILIALLLCAGTEYSFADPAWARQDVDNRQHNRQFQEMRRQEIRNQNKNYAPPAAESANRRNGKMSAEERRALRRQINEASHSIYYR